MPTVQPVISTPNFDRQLTFYQQLLGAVQTSRFPADGPVFFVRLTLGDSELWLVNETDADLSAPPRIVLSVEVDDTDTLLAQVEAAGGRAPGQPNDMPWGQRVAHIYDPDGNMVNLTQTLAT
jgi:uncharacterized glyoxalase superfamily protein PhnB